MTIDDEPERTIVIGRKAVAEPKGAPDVIGHYLIVGKAGEAGRRVEVADKPVTIGRDARQTIALPDTGVSRVHAQASLVNGEVVVEDLVHGRTVFRNTELDDLIIARSDGNPTYNFCVVVDDMDMGVTHVIRGDDHLNNTPRQMNMLRALGVEPPVYAHVPMILGADGAKLSKRHGAVSVLHYQEEGYLPDALLNYLVRLGWAHGDQEVFTREEMIASFDVRDVNKAASAFNAEKLLWLNQQHMMKAPLAALAVVLREQLGRLGVRDVDGAILEGVVNAQRERCKTMKEMAEKSRYFFEDIGAIDPKLAAKHLAGESRTLLAETLQSLEALGEWTPEHIHGALAQVAERYGQGLGKVAQPLRLALTAGTVSPPIDLTVALLGRERTLERGRRALLA
jgi:glutamyl-tRNA synthetase